MFRANYFGAVMVLAGGVLAGLSCSEDRNIITRELGSAGETCETSADCGLRLFCVDQLCQFFDGTLYSISCVPDRSVECTCVDGEAGAQVCDVSGKFYGACNCGGDAGNTDDSAGAGTCGNGAKEGAEECDLGVDNTDVACAPTYGTACQYCTQACTIAVVDGPRCRDGITQSEFEECDDTNSVETDRCRNDCTWNPDWDQDFDGFAAGSDCNDESPNIYPGAPEICNNADDNCEGTIDEGFDMDGDGYVDGLIAACLFSYSEVDCNDGNEDQFPGNPEICDGIDNSCDGSIPASEADADFDGFIPCAGDCNDTNGEFYPDAPELFDELDNNCNEANDDGIDFPLGFRIETLTAVIPTDLAVEGLDAWIGSRLAADDLNLGVALDKNGANPVARTGTLEAAGGGWQFFGTLPDTRELDQDGAQFVALDAEELELIFFQTVSLVAIPIVGSSFSAELSDEDQSLQGEIQGFLLASQAENIFVDLAEPAAECTGDGAPQAGCKSIDFWLGSNPDTQWLGTPAYAWTLQFEAAAADIEY